MIGPLTGEGDVVVGVQKKSLPFLSIDMKTKLVGHVPRINISI